MTTEERINKFKIKYGKPEPLPVLMPRITDRKYLILQQYMNILNIDKEFNKDYQKWKQENNIKW